MEIPYDQLSPESLKALIEEFVSRDGTDYGLLEVSQEKKAEQVMGLLRSHQARIVFDEETESCDIREVD